MLMFVCDRKTTTVPITTPATTIEAATPSWAMPRSAARSASTRGTRAASTTASSTIREPPTSWGSRAPLAGRSCRTRTPRVLSLGSTSTWATSALCTRSAVVRSGFSCVLFSGTGGRDCLSLLIERHGMPSCRRHILSNISNKLPQVCIIMYRVHPCVVIPHDTSFAS